jgi:hypothetical protein
VSERAVSFAARGRLTGVFAEPDPSVARSAAPVVITSNVGVNHHVGPYRFSVDLARTLAQRGFSSLRFDLSGLGNSGVRTDALGDLEGAVDDHREAVRYLAAHGHARFVPVGFCSSVDAVHRLSLEEPRVVGVCFVEGYAFKTLGARLRHPLRYLSGPRWRRLVTRKMPSLLRRLPLASRLGQFTTAFAGQDAIFVRDYPAPSTLRRDYEQLSARGTRQLFVYAGGDGLYVHERQFLEFTGLTSLGSTRKLVHLPHADHTLFRVSDRKQVVAHICAWMDRDVAPEQRQL